MRLFAFLLFAGIALGGPTTKSLDRWKAPENLSRLTLPWWQPAEGSASKVPEGRPFLLYVHGVETQSSARIEGTILRNTAIVLAGAACPWVQSTPGDAADLPFLKALPLIADPMLVVVGRDGKVVGAVVKKKDLNVRRCFGLIERAVDPGSKVRLDRYVTDYVKIMDATERLAKERARLFALEKKGTLDASELAARKEELTGAMAALLTEETELRSLLGTDGGGKGVEPAEDSSGPSAADREALASYRGQRARSHDPFVRALALQALHTCDSPAVTREILAAARQGDAWTVWRAGQALAHMNAPACLKLIVDAIDKGTNRERRAAMLSLESRSHAPAWPLLKRHADSRLFELCSAATRALAAQEDDACRARVLGLMHDHDPRIRVLAARGARSAGALHDLLDDDDWSVRRAAIDALARLHDPASIPHLLFRFQKERGVLRDDSHQALVGLTARTFFFDQSAWQQWWKGAAAGFQPPSKRRIDDARERVAEAGDEEAWVFSCRYHSIRTNSRRLFFLLDVGPSMALQMDVPPGATAEQRKALRTGTRLDLAREELVRLLGGLDREVEFNIAAFAGGVETWRPRLSKASHRAAAIEFVRKLKVIQPGNRAPSSVGAGGARANSPEMQIIPGRTRAGKSPPAGAEHKRDVFGALLTAFGIFDREPLKDYAPPECDTVFLVTDGAPSLGEVTEVPRIAEVLRELNLTRGITVHVISFHTRTSAVYAPLAEAMGGRNSVHGR